MRDNTPSRHHIRPRTRGGGRRRNIVVLPAMFHQGYHHLFQSLTLDEAHAFLDEVMRHDREWSYKELSELRKRLSGGRSN